MILRLSFKKLLKPIMRLIIVVTLIFTAGFAYAGGYDRTLLPGFLIIACLPVIPTLYLFIEYYIVTKKQVVEIKNKKVVFSYKNGSLHSFEFEQINYIKLFKSAGMDKGSFPYQTAEMYYHAKIYTYDGQRFILTSIVQPSLEDALSLLDGVAIERIRTVYSTIYF